MPFLYRLAAPFAVLGFVAFMAGCPSETQVDPVSTIKPRSSKSPSAEPTTRTSPSASPSGTASPTASPSASPTPSVSPTTTTTASPTASPTAKPVTYKQVERLGRPAINEGLIRANNLLNTWNSVDPSVDLKTTTDAKPIVDEATATLKALGNSDAQVAKLFKQLLPDVMRIDTTKTSGYATSKGNVNPLALDNLSSADSTKNQIPVGGRLLEDDVVDVTLILIVPGGLPTQTKLDGLEGDGVDFTTNHQVLSAFPFLQQPY